MTGAPSLLPAGAAEHCRVHRPAAAGAGRLQRSDNRGPGTAEWPGGPALPGFAALPQGGRQGHDCAALPHLPYLPSPHRLH
jgi:hypothetical protein